MQTLSAARLVSEDIAIPACDPGIGHVILHPESPQLIRDVRIEPLKLWPDDRGYFLEVARLTTGLASRFPAESTQISTALSYPETIKAFHFHRFQHDLWVPVSGMLQVALVDLRQTAPTFGVKNTLYIGPLRPWRLLIPPGVAHGYKVVGSDPAVLVYVTDRFYNPEDEGRIPYNEAGIGYDWERQHK